MSVIVNGIGPTSGASALGDLTDIGTMGEPIAQADNLTEVVTAMGGASAVRTAIDAAEDGATLPSATAAGQMLISTASGTSYTARARILSGTLAERDALSPVREGDQWYVSSGASSGTFWQRVNGAWQFRPMGTSADAILDVLGGIKAPTSPTAGHVLTYDGSVWQSAAPTSSGGVTYTLGGSPHDYTAASDYALTGVTAVSGASTGLLGGADGIPPFHALTKGSIAALARTSTGLRLTHATANSGTHSYPYADAAPTLRLPLSRLLTDVQIDLTFAVDLPTRAAGGSDLVAAFAGVCRAATGARDYVLGGAWLVSHPPTHSSAPAELAWALSAAGTFRTTETARNVSAGGEGTSGTTTARGLRVILRGATVEVLTGPAGGSLTRRCYYSDPGLVTARDGLALVVSLAQTQATPAAGYWIELRALVITPL